MISGFRARIPMLDVLPTYVPRLTHALSTQEKSARPFVNTIIVSADE